MAAGHLKVSSSNTSNKSAKFADFYEINKHQDCAYLSYDGKRFRWAGNLESLKHLLKMVLNCSVFGLLPGVVLKCSLALVWT
jgi:hypothetical protein